MAVEAKTILKAARKELGTAEKPPNSNKTKYGKWFGMDGVFWCAIFVSFVMDKVRLGFVRSASCDIMFENFRNGEWGKLIPATGKALPGDIVLYQFSKPGDRDHIGIVLADKDSTITTIEGNTSSPESNGSDRNGGGVYVRTRTKNSLIAGFGRVRGVTQEAPVSTFTVEATRVLSSVIKSREAAKKKAARLRQRGFDVKVEKV